MRIRLISSYNMRDEGLNKTLSAGEMYDAINWDYLPDYIQKKFEHHKNDIKRRRYAVLYIHGQFVCLSNFHFERCKDWQDYGDI